MWVLFVIPGMIIARANSHHRHASAQPTTPIFAAPVSYQPVTENIAPDTSSLIAFETQLKIGFMSDDARDQWRQQIAGQRVHWTGYVFTPGDGTGGPALTSSMNHAAPVIHLQTASRGAKNQLRAIPDGSKVEIDGVLMDDHWLHVIDVSRSW